MSKEVFQDLFWELLVLGICCVRWVFVEMVEMLGRWKLELKC